MAMGNFNEDDSGDKLSVQDVFCPDCDEDYRLSWDDGDNTMYVTCGCGRAETLPDFIERFRSEQTTGHKPNSMYQ